MNIPGHAESLVQERIPADLDADQIAGRHCVYCGVDFAATRRKPVPVGQDRNVRGCRYCLTEIIAEARVERDKAARGAKLKEEARVRYNRSLAERYRQASNELHLAVQCIEELVEEEVLDALELSYLMLQMESAYEWAKTWKPEMYLEDGPSPMADLDLELKILHLHKSAFRNLAYQVINEAMLPEPDMCEDLECPEDCDGKHEWSDIDFGYDSVFERLSEHGCYFEGGRKEDLPGLDFHSYFQSLTRADQPR